jgi:two-component system OmpR family response regulator/two-component system response regulator QseB
MAESGMAANILVIEDDPALGAGLVAALRGAGYAARAADSLAAARDALQAETWAALVLDLGLPDGDGLELLRLLRRQGGAVPVMILTATDRRETRLAGLDGGADDYVTKPYDLDEVLARLRALLRRSLGLASDVLPFGVPAGAYELDLGGQVARAGARTLMLTQREFRVLSVLVRRAGRWVSKPDIEYAVYEDAVEIESNTIEAAVYGLRRKLGAQTILTARGLGYMIPR